MNVGIIVDVRYLPEQFGGVGCGTLSDYTSGCRRAFDTNDAWNAGDIVGFDLNENGNPINMQPAIAVPTLRGNSRGNYGGVASVSSYVLQSDLSAQKLHEIQSIWASNVPGGTL
jgi:hypothetical protein